MFPALGWGIGLTIHGMVVFFLAGGINLQERMVQAERDRLAAAQSPADVADDDFSNPNTAMTKT